MSSRPDHRPEPPLGTGPTGTDATWAPGGGRRVGTTSDYRLTRMLQREPLRCASLSEYAQATGIDTVEIIDLLGELLDDGSFAIEVHGDDVFLHTAPAGRPVPPHLAEVPANLWETLRSRFSVAHSHQLWKLTRALEASGWRVEHRLGRLMFGLGRLEAPPVMGVDVGNTVVPLLLFPTSVALNANDGLLDTYEAAGAAAVGVVCAQGALDEMSTAVRAWMLGRQILPSMSALILESPRFNPTLLTPEDGAVTPRAVAVSTLQEEFWAP
jgi:hypothetical protein